MTTNQDQSIVNLLQIGVNGVLLLREPREGRGRGSGSILSVSGKIKCPKSAMMREHLCSGLINDYWGFYFLSGASVYKRQVVRVVIVCQTKQQSVVDYCGHLIGGL